VAGRIGSIVGNRARDLQACSIVPQPTTLPWILKMNSDYFLKQHKQAVFEMEIRY
jgi:hypothetical protein